MIKNILKEKIKESIKSNNSFNKFLLNNYKTLKVEDIIIKEIEDFLLTKEEVYEFSNFKNLFYDTILNFNPSRLANFLRNVLNNDPKKEKTYQHILNDIESKLEETYNIPNNYLKMKRSQLDELCDELILKENYFELNNIRKFIKDNFRIFDYNSYLKENRDLAVKILKSGGEDETDKTYVRLRKLLEGKNMGYLGIFTYFNKIEKIPFISIKRLYERILKDNDILHMLPELIINYMRHKLPYKNKDGRTYTKHFERLEDDLLSIEEKHTAKLFADDYPATFRKGLLDIPDFIEAIKELTSNKEKVEMYNKFFLKKVARYKTQKELLDSLIKFVYSNTNDEAVRTLINNTYMCDMVFDDGELVVARVRNQDALQTLANDTSWCIKDSLSYWNDYVGENNIQLVIIDLTEPQTSLYKKIGCTLRPKGWHDYNFYTAHIKNDTFINEDQLNKRLEKYDTSLEELYNVATTMGNNEYYAPEEIQNDRYGY
jgi:hypothetical protein